MAFTPRFKLALLAAAISLFFLGVLLVILPTVLVNRPQTKVAVQRYFEEAWGGKIGFGQVKLSLFPRVCASVDHPRLDISGIVAAQATSIDLCLKLVPLLRGRWVAESIRAQSPEILLPIAPHDSAGGSPGLPDPRRLLVRMTDLARQIPATAVEVTGGRMELAGPGGQRLEAHNLNLRLRHDGEELAWSLQGESAAAGTFSTHGRLETGSLRGTGTLRIADFRPRPLQAFFRPDAHLQVLDAQMDLELTAVLDGPGRVTAAIAGKAPTIAFGYRHRQTHLSLDRFEARLELSEQRLSVTIPEFSARTPRAELELAFFVDEEAQPKIGINLKGRGDLAGARDFTLALLHEIPEALLTCEILRSGEISHIQVGLYGDSWSGLAGPSSLKIHGRLENGRVYLPWIDLDLDAVSGDVLIAGGILEGRDVKAHYQGTRGENGSLRVGLSRADPILQLAIDAHADLSALPPVLARVVPDPAFRREVARVSGFSGTARGTLRIEGTHTNVAVEVQASELDVQAHHQLIAYPLRFQGGEFVYDGDSITLRGVDAAIGNSKLFEHNLRLALSGNRPFESSSSRAVIDLSEVFNLFRDQAPFNQLSRLGGVLTATSWHFSGHAGAPDSWRLSANGTVQDLSLESERVPGPVHLASGGFDWQSQTIRYQSPKGSIGRSELKGLTVEVDWTGPSRAELRALEMDVALDDLSQLMQSSPTTAAYAAALAPATGIARMRDVRLQTRLLPEGLKVDRFKAALKNSVLSSAPIGLPLTLASGDIDWQGSQLQLQITNASLGNSAIQHLSLSGDWRLNGGLELSADGTVIECGEIYPRLPALPALKGLREEVRGLQGVLSTPHISLKGPLRDPRRWRVRAASELKGIVLTTTFLDDPIELPAGRLTFAAAQAPEAGPTTLRLDNARVRIGANAADLAGDIALAAAETTLHLDIRAEAIDWSHIEKISDRLARHRRSDSRPVRGWMNLRVERLAIDRLQLSPVDAEALLASDGTRIEIERAGLCGMTFIGRMTFDGPIVDAYLIPVVDVMPLDGVVACLSDEQSLFSGTFNLDGQLRFRGRRDDVVKALNGRLALVAEDGTIRQSLLFARIFSLLNLTEIYRGKLPDFNSQGLDYKRSTAVIEVKGGKLLVNDWSIDGHTLWFGARGEIDIATRQIDFTIMVSPFKTIDRIINSIPGLRWILGGRLVAIPMRAVGSLEDPQVIPLSPSAVGTSILEMIERTLLLPFEIIQPLVPGMKEAPSSTISR